MTSRLRCIAGLMPAAVLMMPATGLVRAESSGGAPPSSGPDVAVSRIGLSSSEFTSVDDFHYWGTADGIRAFSFATTSCNVGDHTAEWQHPNDGPNHPVIGQNMFRLLNGRFEHIGQSWLKHSFCAVNEYTCGDCQATSCSTLGIGCADTYTSTLNNGANGGPKSQINPQGQGPGGTHTHPYSLPVGPTEIRGRLQISDADIEAGGRNFIEGQYVTHDEPLENRHNNMSWREVDLELTSIVGTEPGQASVHFQEAAIYAWQLIDGANIAVVDVPDEGRFLLGYRATDNGDGTWHYEYAMQNLNSDRAAGSFAVPVPDGVTVSNIGFHDVDYHSGEPYSLADWDSSIQGGVEPMLTWSTLSFEDNADANALRWGTLYNFRFDADSHPMIAEAVIGLFKPGTPTSLSALTLAPQPLDACDDGSVCTLDSTTRGGGCLHQPLSCDDGDPCTVDACGAATGCLNGLVNCSDADACTIDTCDGVGGCLHEPVDIDDGNICTVDSCDVVGGVVHEPVDCDDENVCTTDFCSLPSGSCVNVDISCDDDNACTADGCDPVSGCTHEVVVECPEGQTCNVETGQCVLSCPEDLDNSGDVGAFDLAIVLGNWGPNPGHPADLDGDGIVGPADLAQILGNWGSC